MQEVQVFDVDGTLTFNKQDAPDCLPAYETYAYWTLLSKRFCSDHAALQQTVEAWDRAMQTTPDTEKDASSFSMMDKTVRELLSADANAEKMQAIAERITDEFLVRGAIQIDAIKYLNSCLQRNIICVLTTGSYLDGLRGFVAYLVKAGHLTHSNNLLLNGAVVDWKAKRLLLANVGHFKTQNLKNTLTEHGINQPWFSRAFGDDPMINDRGILALPYQQEKHGESFVIKAVCNLDEQFDPRYQRISWAEIIAC